MDQPPMSTAGPSELPTASEIKAAITLLTVESHRLMERALASFPRCPVCKFPLWECGWKHASCVVQGTVVIPELGNRQWKMVRTPDRRRIIVPYNERVRPEVWLYVAWAESLLAPDPRHMVKLSNS